MSILEIAEIYLSTTRPSELKKQGINDIVDVMIRIRHFLDLQARNKKVANNRAK